MPRNRARRLDSYRSNRRIGTRTAKARILIVCEGSKTEPNYFKAIRQELRLLSVDVEVLRSHIGTEPRQVIESAVEILAQHDYEKDFVFCVFDQDEHRSFWAAIQLAQAKNAAFRNKGRNIVFRAIPSVPCFEIWLLMHYVTVTREIERDDACRILKEHPPGYTKGCAYIYERTSPYLEEAYRNARAVKCNEQHLCDDRSRKPYTEVDDVVKMLRELRVRP